MEDSVNNVIPLVSVICWTYNQEDYISDCIEGVMMQKTDFPFEMIIHDDASTDNTLSIVKKYQQKYPNIIRVIEEDENQYKKQDLALLVFNYIRGDFVAICEGDDYWIDPFKLQRQYNLFRRNPGLTYCFSNRIVYNETSCTKREVKHKQKKYTTKDFFAGFNPGLQSVCFRKNSITEEDLIFGWNHKIHGDRIFPIFSAKKGYALCLPNTTAVYRVTGKGVSSSIAANQSHLTWFDYAIDDFYHLHESFDYPSIIAYTKGVTAYTFNFIRKTRKIGYGIKKVSKYGNRPRFFMGILICCSLLIYLFNRAMYYLRNSWGKVYDYFERIIITRQFSSAIFETNSENCFLIENKKCIKRFKTPKLNIGNKAVTIADAFLYSNGYQMSLFYELQDSYRAKGILMETNTNDLVHWSKPTKALEEQFHLSFPNVFDLDGEIWMLPETFMSKQVRLYCKDKNTNTFVLNSILLEGEKYVDSFLYKQNGTYYLFTSVQFEDNSYDLKLYFSDSITGPFVEHIQSPISHGKAYQRNAGRLIQKEGHLYRPAQECTNYYGQNVHIMEVKKLSITEYDEVPCYLDIIPPTKGFGVGGHQFSTCELHGKEYIAIDILHPSINVYIILKRLLNKIGL